MKENIVINDSEGYGYNYASLSDIAKQGFEIPKMKTEVDEHSNKEYVCYYDKEMNMWVRGAQVVVPDNKGMNAAQCYGSALTYARRYTTLMALGLACEDDKQLETNEEPKASPKQITLIENLYDKDNLMKILEYYQISMLNELTKSQASEVIQRKKGNEK